MQLTSQGIRTKNETEPASRVSSRQLVRSIPESQRHLPFHVIRLPIKQAFGPPVKQIIGAHLSESKRSLFRNSYGLS
jgi:hypothetical protein